MSPAQVQEFLHATALERYAEALAGVDGATLVGMDDAALHRAGVMFAPHRRKIARLMRGGRGASGSGSGATAAILRAGASVAAHATPLLASVCSALAAVQAQLGSTLAETLIFEDAYSSALTKFDSLDAYFAAGMSVPNVVCMLAFPCAVKTPR